jgi:hypothetical protein
MWGPDVKIRENRDTQSFMVDVPAFNANGLFNDIEA